MIKKLARQQHSAALAQLASRVTAVVRYGSAGGDPFVKIRGLIEDMIAKLENEAKEEATEKAYCDEELSKTTAKKTELDTEIGKLTTKIDQDAARSTELKAEVKDLQSELATMEKEQTEAEKVRQDEHAEYLIVKEDLEKGIAGVRKALTCSRSTTPLALLSCSSQRLLSPTARLRERATASSTSCRSASPTLLRTWPRSRPRSPMPSLRTIPTLRSTRSLRPRRTRMSSTRLRSSLDLTRTSQILAPTVKLPTLRSPP